MPFCEHCGNEIGYLPFTCNYCGGTFCKQHRLPENHECSFELKHKPITQPTSRKARQSNQEVPLPIPQDNLYSGPRQLKKYLKRQEKERKRTRRMAQPRMRISNRPWKMGNGTLFIILMILIFSAIEIGRVAIEDIPGVSSLNDLGPVAIYIWRIITSPFIYAQDIWGFFFLFIMVYFLRFMGQVIESQFGTKFLLKFYFLCVVFSWGIYALLILPFALIFPTIQEFTIFIPSASAPAAILGIIALLLFPMLNSQVTGIMGFFPLRTKGKTFLLIIILFIMLPAFLGLLVYEFPYSLYSFVIYIPQLGGMLAAYLISYQKIKLRN